jgi:hypothetical protein
LISFDDFGRVTATVIGVPPGGFHGLFHGYNGGSVYGALVKSLTFFKIFKLKTMWICTQLAERSILSIRKPIVWLAVEEMQYSRKSWGG